MALTKAMTGSESVPLYGPAVCTTFVVPYFIGLVTYTIIVGAGALFSPQALPEMVWIAANGTVRSLLTF